MEVRGLGADEASSDAAWDRFVDAAPDATPFHRIAWKRIVEDVFGHTPHYLVAVDGGAVRGVLPLFEIHGLRSGRIVSSVPYGTYGGICGTDPEAVARLLAAARRLGEQLRVRYVELRQLFHPLPDLPSRRPFATFARTLDTDPDAVFRSIPSKRRNMIRKGRRHGLEARHGWTALDAFYEVYAINRRHLGAPPFSRRLFEVLRDRLGSAAALLTAWHEGHLVGGVLSLYHRDRVMPYYGASLPDARGLAVSDFLYWELMRAACVSGHRVFDFGESHEGSGGWEFKRLWGFTPEPIAYQYILVRDREPPGRQPASPGTLVELWKALPLTLTTRLGPQLIRWLPLH